MGIKIIRLLLFSTIIELLLPATPLVMITVAVLFITCMDNKGASIISFIEGDNTINVYIVYNLLLVLVVLNLLGLVPGVFTPGSLVQIVLDLLRYLVIFVPGGAPIVLLPLL